MIPLLTSCLPNLFHIPSCLCSSLLCPCQMTSRLHSHQSHLVKILVDSKLMVLYSMEE